MSSADAQRAHKLAKLVVPVAALAVLWPAVEAPYALGAGIVLGLSLGDPWPARTKQLAPGLLATAVVGLGAGMDLGVVARVGVRGIGYTAFGIAAAFGLGALLRRLLRVERDIATLVTVGTAICGGSAIAAVSPAIGADDRETSVALIAVFVLNAIALVIFPPIGHALGLSQAQFGLWSALAIHDTSSVVGAATSYGAQAAEIATSAKLARALWIVPVTFAIAAWRSRSRSADDTGAKANPKKPWFILGFIAVAAAVTYVPGLRAAGTDVAFGAKRLLALTLFVIGLRLSRPALRAIGARPLILAVILWLALAAGSLAAIHAGWIAT
jgi:uncharacterized integral membrane protein (TIGR00698 family)